MSYVNKQKVLNFIPWFIFFILFIVALAAASRNSISFNKKVEPQKANTIATSTTAVKGKEFIVIYTARGFRPATTTISVGDSILFENKSNHSFWPVSHGYPIVTTDFDSHQPLLPGRNYSYIFTEKGILPYFNKLDPTQKGVVIVK